MSKQERTTNLTLPTFSRFAGLCAKATALAMLASLQLAGFVL